jgi:hypothetical protein
LKTRQEQEQVSFMPKDEVPNDGGKTFDFSAVPNILDNNPDLDNPSMKRKKKQRKQKNGMLVNW